MVVRVAWPSAASLDLNAAQAACTADPTLAIVVEPPCSLAAGNVESPSSNRTRSTGKPSASAATWVAEV